MERKQIVRLISAAFLFVMLFSVSACYSYGPSNRLFTPVPTLIPAAALNPLDAAIGSSAKLSCAVRPVDLLGSWVSAGYSDTEVFSFVSEDGQTCSANYAEDIEPLFKESNLWYDGSPACISCHNSTLDPAFQSMDLSTYEGILAGSQRSSAEETGNDLLSGGDWEASRLYYMLINRLMPLGRPTDSPEKGPVIYAGSVPSE